MGSMRKSSFAGARSPDAASGSKEEAKGRLGVELGPDQEVGMQWLEELWILCVFDQCTLFLHKHVPILSLILFPSCEQ